MTNISKHSLSEKDLAGLYKQMDKFIAKLDTTSSAYFLSELLGAEERIMVAKRFAAIAMYAEGNTPYRVWQLLHMSPTTAERIHLDFEVGRYKHTVGLMKKHKKDYAEFWETLEVILRAGMPPRGRGRWKSVLKSLEQ
jgi:hypothetical protein